MKSREDGKKKKKKVESWGPSTFLSENFWKKKFRGWQKYSACYIGLDQALSVSTMWVPVEYLLTTHSPPWLLNIQLSLRGTFLPKLHQYNLSVPQTITFAPRFLL
jgi:hypothetical protein